MPSPKQRVIIYRHGISKDKRKYKEEWNQKQREQAGYPVCERCGKRYKNPDISHYSDFKNKIRCF